MNNWQDALEITAPGAGRSAGFNGLSLDSAQLNRLGAPRLMVAPRRPWTTGTSATLSISATAPPTSRASRCARRQLTGAEVFLVAGVPSGSIVIERGASINTVGRGAPGFDSSTGFTYRPGPASVVAVSNGWINLLPPDADQPPVGAGAIRIGACGPACAGEAQLYSEGTIAFATNKAFELDNAARYGARYLTLAVGASMPAASRRWPTRPRARPVQRADAEPDAARPPDGGRPAARRAGAGNADAGRQRFLQLLQQCRAGHAGSGHRQVAPADAGADRAGHLRLRPGRRCGHNPRRQPDLERRGQRAGRRGQQRRRHRPGVAEHRGRTHRVRLRPVHSRRRPGPGAPDAGFRQRQPARQRPHHRQPSRQPERVPDARRLRQRRRLAIQRRHAEPAHAAAHGRGRLGQPDQGRRRDQPGHARRRAGRRDTRPGRGTWTGRGPAQHRRHRPAFGQGGAARRPRWS